MLVSSCLTGTVIASMGPVADSTLSHYPVFLGSFEPASSPPAMDVKVQGQLSIHAKPKVVSNRDLISQDLYNARK